MTATARFDKTAATGGALRRPHARDNTLTDIGRKKWLTVY
jgi:hypothetical protein